jgi:transposase-like protein
MTDGQAETAFRKLRWPDTDSAPVCPHCGGVGTYDCRRPNGGPRFECRACGKDFSVTSGTLFANYKLPLKAYLAPIAIFCNEVSRAAPRLS